MDSIREAAVSLLASEGTSLASPAHPSSRTTETDDAVFQALVENQVDQVILHRESQSAARFADVDQLFDRLKGQRLRTAATLVRQEAALAEAGSILDEASVPAVVLKGALVRQIIYPKPIHRPSLDVDVLVSHLDALRATQALVAHGFKASVASHSDTHEVALRRHGASIDLHWSVLRPGRMRVDITDDILAQRVRRGELWGPNDVHLTVIMLVHPAISDHVTARLISAVDLDRWLRSREIPWDGVIEVLDRIGLRTAAWAMLAWTHALFGTPVPDEVWSALAPSLLRQRYIEAWLSRHPGDLYWRHPWLVRGGFSLALQDRLSDAARALWKLARKDRLSLDP